MKRVLSLSFFDGLYHNGCIDDDDLEELARQIEELEKT